MKKFAISSLVLGVLVANVSGCSSTHASKLSKTDLSAESNMSEWEAENVELRSRLSQLQVDKDTQEAMLSEKIAASSMQSSSAMGSSTLPPNPQVGQCYARVYTAPKYETVQETVLVSPESVRLKFEPAQYEWVEESVLVSEASERLEVVPATYKTVTEQMLVSDASSKLVEVPAKYETVSEKVLVKAAYTTWKKGSGAFEKVNETTGEIMCLVDVPAEYKTITKRVLVEPAKASSIEIPAKYTSVTRSVVDQESYTTKIVIPAKYKTVKVRKLVSGPKELQTVIPAEYNTISKTKLVADSTLEWKTILCETNTTPGLVSRLQRTLDEKGYNPGAIDGVLGKATLNALISYQKDNKLASGQITMDSLKHLGVSM